MNVREVAKKDLERVKNEDWVDRTKRPCVSGSTAFIPVRDGYPFDREIERPVQYRGRGFFMLGDIAILRGKMPTPAEVRRIADLKKPRGIILIRSINEVTRTPDCVVLNGEAGEVCHTEHGYRYILDPCRVMFSQGNLTEKRRMATLVREKREYERVADMFAGIGYFTVPMAGAGAKVHAIEINPVAFQYLKTNIAINGLAGLIKPSLGDCRNLLSGTYDRIIMGHFDAITMLPAALAHVREGSTIHLHSTMDMKDRIRSDCAGAGFSADVHVHRVKKYGPHTWHLVSDIVIA